MYGHIEKLAREIQKGASSVPGVDAILYQVTNSWPRSCVAFVDAKQELVVRNLLVVLSSRETCVVVTEYVAFAGTRDLAPGSAGEDGRSTEVGCACH